LAVRVDSVSIDDRNISTEMGSANAPQVRVKKDRAIAKQRFMQSPILQPINARVFDS
jgi:hypothetical protein